MEHWNIGTMEQWNNGIKEQRIIESHNIEQIFTLIEVVHILNLRIIAYHLTQNHL